MTRDEYVQGLKYAAKYVSTQATVAAIIAAAPFLAPFKIVLDAIIGKIMEFAVDKTELGLFFLYIDLRTNQQAKDFESAVYRFVNAKKEGTDEDKKKAELDLIDNFKRLAKFNR